MTKTYSRGKSLVFSLEIVEMANPIVGEQRACPQHEEFTHSSTNVTDLEKCHEEKVAKKIMMDKEYEIKRLEDKLTEANSLITCLQQENM